MYIALNAYLDWAGLGTRPDRGDPKPEGIHQAQGREGEIRNTSGGIMASWRL